MSTADDETQVMPALSNGGNGNGAASSLFDTLRATRAAHAAPLRYDIDVQGYDGRLVVRCGPIASTRFATITAKYERSKAPERDFNLAADVLLAACVEVLARVKSTDPLQPFDAEEPMQLDERLAHGLGFDDATSGRELVRKLFGAAPMPEVAMTEAVGGYMEWARSVDADATETFMGESHAATR
jgi:hypothetical protein